jgi:hypothetical protein
MVKDILKSLDYLIISITSEAISNGGDVNPRPKLSDGSPSLKFTSTQKASSPTADAKMVKSSPIGSTPLCDPIPSRCASPAPSTVQQPSTATDHPLGRSVHTRPPPVAPVAPPPPLIGEERDEPVLWVPSHRKMAAVMGTTEVLCTGFAGAVHLLHFWILVERNSIFW